MRKQVFGRKLKRDKNERKALFSGLISAMVLHGKIKTTEQKAKAIKPDVEKIVTKAKKDEATARRLLKSKLLNHEIDKMVNDIAPRFKDRTGGYTRIIKTGRRFSDNASMVIMEWVEGPIVEEKGSGNKSSKPAQRKSLAKTKTDARKTVRKTGKKKNK